MVGPKRLNLHCGQCLLCFNCLIIVLADDISGRIIAMFGYCE